MFFKSVNSLRAAAIIQEKKDAICVINKSKVHHKMIHDTHQPCLLYKSLYPLKQSFVNKTMTNNGLLKTCMLTNIRIQVRNHSRQGSCVFKKKKYIRLDQRSFFKDQETSPSKMIFFWVQYKMYAFIKKMNLV